MKMTIKDKIKFWLLLVFLTVCCVTGFINIIYGLKHANQTEMIKGITDVTKLVISNSLTFYFASNYSDEIFDRG
nr:MAG TPA: Bacterial virulence factor hemolysin [Caudoviricetes sp.]